MKKTFILSSLYSLGVAIVVVTVFFDLNCYAAQTRQSGFSSGTSPKRSLAEKNSGNRFLEENVSQAEEYYTIQAATYTNFAKAQYGFQYIQQYLNQSEKSWLRVELISGFYTLRVGRFERYAQSSALFNSVKKIFPSAITLSAFIKKERIKKSLGSQSVESVISSHPKKQTVTAQKDSVGNGGITTVPSTKKPKIDFGPTEVYTVQLGSFPGYIWAVRLFEKMKDELPPERLDALRVEVISTVKTVRVGAFEKMADANELSRFIKENIGIDSLVLSAFIKPERVKRGYPSTQKMQADSEIRKYGQDSKKSSEDSHKKKISAFKTTEPADTYSKDDVVNDVGERLKEQQLLNASGGIQQEEKSSEKIIKKELPEEQVEKDPIQQKENSFEVVKVINKDDSGSWLRSPNHLVFDSSVDELYVLSGASDRLVVYGADYFPIQSLGAGRGLKKISCAFIDKDGFVYIWSGGPTGKEPRLTIFNQAFLIEKEVFLENLAEDVGSFSPSRIAVDLLGNIYLISKGRNVVLILGSNGQLVKRMFAFVEGGVEEEEIIEKKAFPLKDIAVDSKGNIYLLSEELSKGNVYNKKGEFLYSFGTPGGSSGRLSRPQGVALDENKNAIYVVDYMRHSVLVYDLSGNFHYEFGGKGWAPRWFNFPTDLEIGRNGGLFVADFYNNRVQVLDVNLTGEFADSP